MLPLLDADKAVSELRWAKEHGACGIFKRGYDLEKQVSDAHFMPVYEEANSLELPLCVHTGHPLPFREWDRGFPVMGAFTSIVTSGLASKFPKLRFGFIEAGASWIPYNLTALEMQQRAQRLQERAQRFKLAEDLRWEDRLYVTIDPLEDVEAILRYGTEDNLIVGTDYCHSDPSANLAALDEVQRWADDGRVTQSQARKILETNARTLFGF